MKKIALILISIILVLSPVFYLTGCGGGGDFAPGESEEIIVDDGEFEDAEEAGKDGGAAIDSQAIFQPIIDKYQNAITETRDIANTEDYAKGLEDSFFDAGIPINSEFFGAHLGYWIKDINGDGVDELLIGGRYDDTEDAYDFFALFIIDGDEAKRITPNEPVDYYLREDGKIQRNNINVNAVLYDFDGKKLAFSEGYCEKDGTYYKTKDEADFENNEYYNFEEISESEYEKYTSDSDFSELVKLELTYFETGEQKSDDVGETETKKTEVEFVKDETYSVDRNTPSHGGLVLRDGPGSSYNDIGIVKEGWVIQFTGESENNYISVEYYVNNVYYSGWIITDYLRDDESGGDIYNRDDSLQTETTVENEAPAMPTVPEEVLSDLYYPSESLNASNFYRLQDQDEEGYIYGIFMQETAAIKFTEENKSIQGFSLNKIDSETGIPEINYGSEEDYNYIPIDNKAWKLELKSWTVATCVYKFAYSSEKYIIFTREDDDDQFWCVFMTKDVYEKFYKLCTEENALKLSDYFTCPDRDKIQEMQDKLINVLDKCS